MDLVLVQQARTPHVDHPSTESAVSRDLGRFRVPAEAFGRKSPWKGGARAVFLTSALILTVATVLAMWAFFMPGLRRRRAPAAAGSGSSDREPEIEGSDADGG